MKKSMIFAAFMLSALVWAGAQQPNDMPAQSGSQATSPSSQMPSQSPSATPSTPEQSAPQATPQAGAAGQSMNGSVTEGCLGGTNPNFTITDASGKSYKLNLPAGADGTRLTSHVGESVQVAGDVKSGAIDVTKIGKGTGSCPAK
ncbi:MAG TPA: hypothetical protein VGL89_07390 [Candidatus Koribacter sp.]|jgi:hypothetical protein